jgi:hypothetical protein
MQSVRLIRFISYFIGFLKYEALISMKYLIVETVIKKAGESDNFKVSRIKLNVIIDEHVKQVSFKDVSFNVNKETDVILHDQKYIFINSIDQFTGTLVKDEESKEVEPFLQKLIEGNKPSSSSAYPLGELVDYTILFDIKDLKSVILNDALIINNVKDADKKSNLINERAQKTLDSFEFWDILPDPVKEGSNGQIIPKHTSVQINIGVGLVLKDLNTFLKIVTTDYSFLKVDTLSCFYYMDQDRIDSLDKFMSENRFLKRLQLRVAYEEDFHALLKLLVNHSILNIKIDYHGEITDTMKKASKEFIVKCLDRSIEIRCLSTDQVISKQFKHENYSNRFDTSL